MTDDTSQPAGGEATNIDDRLASFDFDAQPAAPAAKPADNSEAGDALEPHEAAAAAELGAEQPDEDDPEINLRDNTKVRLSALKKAWRPDWEREVQEYTEKRRKLDADTQQFQQHAQTLTQREQHYAQALDTAITILQNRLPKAPDAALLETDPFAYQQQDVAHRKAMQELHELAGRQQQLNAVAQQRSQQQLQQHVAKQHEILLTAMPELKDPEKRAKAWKEWTSYGASVGFSPQEMAQVQDARVLMVLKDAAWAKSFRERAAKIKEKEREAKPMPPPTTSPARRESASERERGAVRDQLSRLRKTGSVKDGEAFLSNFD